MSEGSASVKQSHRAAVSVCCRSDVRTTPRKDATDRASSLGLNGRAVKAGRRPPGGEALTARWCLVCR